MQKCLKCQGVNFVKEGKSNIIPTITYVLCSCGNVMIRDLRYNDKLMPTPESDSDLTRTMIADAGIALGISQSSVSLTGDDLYAMISNYINNQLNEDNEDCCEECGKPKDYCECDWYVEDDYADDEEDYEDEEESDTDRFINLTEKIIKESNNKELNEMWEKAKKEGVLKEIINETNNSVGFEITEAFEQVDDLVDSIPDEIADSTGLSKEDLFAKAMGKCIGKDFSGVESMFTSKKETEKVSKEERKTYIILEKDGGWTIVNNATKKELEEKINDCKYDEFLVKEILPVKVKTEVKFTVQ